LLRTWKAVTLEVTETPIAKALLLLLLDRNGKGTGVLIFVMSSTVK
jgi:hypothetical protein